MKTLSAIQKRSILLTGISIMFLLLMGNVATKTGPLAPVPVTITQVEKQIISPALFGIGLVEARYRYEIGPATTGYLSMLDSHVGDWVSAGQVLGEMDPLDMDSKIAAKDASIKRSKSVGMAAEARLADSAAREQYAKLQSNRYTELVAKRIVSNEVAEAKHTEYQIARASLTSAKADLNAAKEEIAMLWADREGLVKQRNNLQFISPVDGLVVGRYFEPGSTVIAGQPVLEVIDPSSIWINVRFDQLQADGLSMGLPATITLRSKSGQRLTGQIVRVEPLADSVTEEILAKVTFDQFETLPAIGELAEVNVTLPQKEAAPTVPNASIKHLNGETGVWIVGDDLLEYVPVTVGASDLDGRVQILQGLQAGDTVVVYSREELKASSRIRIVDRLVDGVT